MLRITAAALLIAVAGAAQAQDLSGEVTIWSWNVAASSLEAVATGFMSFYLARMSVAGRSHTVTCSVPHTQVAPPWSPHSES